MFHLPDLRINPIERDDEMECHGCICRDCESQDCELCTGANCQEVGTRKCPAAVVDSHAKGLQNMTNALNSSFFKVG